MSNFFEYALWEFSDPNKKRISLEEFHNKVLSHFPSIHYYYLYEPVKTKIIKQKNFESDRVKFPLMVWFLDKNQIFKELYSFFDKVVEAIKELS